MCDFLIIDQEDIPAPLVPLQDGSCPMCKTRLVLHRHNPVLIGGWTFVHNYPFDEYTEEYKRLCTPGDDQFAECPEGHGCWKLAGDRAWHIYRPCCAQIRLREDTAQIEKSYKEK